MDLAIPGIFAAGVATFFTPCVLPLIPIYLSALVGSDVRSVKGMARGGLLLRSVLFSIGFITVFSLLGLGAASIGSFLQDNKAAAQVVGAILILTFALKFLGLIRIPFFDRTLRADDRKLTTKVGAVNSLIMGVVFAAGWSPCVGPVLGSVLTYTASRSSEMLTGVIYLTAYGLGFAVPLFITALFAEAGVKFIRSASRFLPVFEKAVGVLLLFTAASLMFDLVMQTEEVTPDTSLAVVTDPGSPVVPDEFPLMVEFYSSGCTICERMAPVVEGLKYECSGNNVEIRQVDVSQANFKHFAKDYRIIGVPTFVFIEKSGMEIARLVGEQTEDNLRQAISALRGEPCPGVSYIPDNFLKRIDGTVNKNCDDDKDAAKEPGSCGG